MDTLLAVVICPVAMLVSIGLAKAVLVGLFAVLRREPHTESHEKWQIPISANQMPLKLPPTVSE